MNCTKPPENWGQNLPECSREIEGLADEIHAAHAEIERQQRIIDTARKQIERFATDEWSAEEIADAKAHAFPA